MTTLIRAANLPAEMPDVKAFCHAMNVFEARFEGNRRLDPAFTDEYWQNMEKAILSHNGRMLMAESAEGSFLGFILFCEHKHPPFVRHEEQVHGYVMDLFVIEEARRQGVGQALLQSAEDHFRAKGIATLFIGVLAGNHTAQGAYEKFGFTPYAVELRKRI